MNRRNHSVTLLEATQESPILAGLTRAARESSSRLEAIKSLIPPALWPCIQAGPIEDAVWCLLLDNNAVAAKLRQLTPALEAHLRSKGLPVEKIRWKVRTTPKYQ